MTAPTPKQVTAPLARPVTTLYGVGPERAAQLARLDIRTVEDLLLHRPRRYEDRRQLRPIAQLQLGEPATTRGKVVALGVKWYKHRTKSIFELVLDDGTARLHCRWWNLPFMEKYFKVGDDVIVFGKPVDLKPRTMDHPETEVLEGGEEDFIHFNRLTPIYPLTEGLPQRWLRSLIWRTLERFEGQIPEPWPELHLAEQAAKPPHPRPRHPQAAFPGGRARHPAGPSGGSRWTSSSRCKSRFSSAGRTSRPRPAHCRATATTISSSRSSPGSVSS